MTTITGEMAVMLSVLGLPQGDSRILDAIVLGGAKMEVFEFDGDPERATYFSFMPTGMDLIFEDDILIAAMVRTQPDPQDHRYGLYPRPDALINGLSPIATRAEAADFFGTPERVGPDFDRYEVNDHYLRLAFTPDDQIRKFTAMLEPL